MRRLPRVSPKLAPTGSASFSEPPATHIRTLNSSRSCLKVVETFRFGGNSVGRFQSTPPRRRATLRSTWKPYVIEFQSTPPRRRATSGRCLTGGPSCSFNPRPPGGGRHDVWRVARHDGQFQSTPPRRRATETRESQMLGQMVSIHAPPEEGDGATPGRPRRRGAVSIHAPPEEGDASPWAS